MQSLKDRIWFAFHPQARLTEVERGVLASIAAQLSGEVADCWAAQVSTIRHVYRAPHCVEVNFYRSRTGEAPQGLRLLKQKEASVVATVEIQLPDFGRSLEARVTCVAGQLFMIEYLGSANYYEEALGMDPAPVAGFVSTILVDLQVE